MTTIAVFRRSLWRLFGLLVLACLLGPATSTAGPLTPRDLPAAELGIEGRVALVNFWATWCGPCRAELPLLDQLHRNVADKGAMVVTINLDTQSRRAQGLVKHLGLQAPVIYDPEGRLAARFEPPTMPTSFLVDAAGQVRRVIAGSLGQAEMAALESEVLALVEGHE